MILDTSALIAILGDEPEAPRLIALLEHALEGDVARISAGTLIETGIVAEARWGEAGGRELDELLAKLGTEVVHVTKDQADIAREAFRRFGRGRHPAALNFGDCFAYALAVDVNEPLLFVGGDFARTDVLVAAS